MTASALPARFRPLLAAARAGELPRGPVGLASGLVTDLGEYVQAWEAAWGNGDERHVASRLDEALRAWGGEP